MCVYVGNLTEKELDIIGRVGGSIGMHMLSTEDWKEGRPIDYWVDENGVDCVKYESGNWWHYAIVNGRVEWW